MEMKIANEKILLSAIKFCINSKRFICYALVIEYFLCKIKTMPLSKTFFFFSLCLCYLVFNPKQPLVAMDIVFV